MLKMSVLEGQIPLQRSPCDLPGSHLPCPLLYSSCSSYQGKQSRAEASLHLEATDFEPSFLAGDDRVRMASKLV